MAENSTPTRRGFLDWFITLCCAVAGAAMVIPGLMYLWPAAKGGGKENVEVDGAGTLAVGQSKTVQVSGKAVVVVRQSNDFVAFAASCTHLGCLVKWDRSRAEFLCPCHAGVFDKNGAVVSGPPPAPLSSYRVKEVDGKVFVSA